MQQLTRWLPALLAVGVCLPLASAWADEEPLDDPRAVGSLLRLFTDSGKVSVRSLMGDYTLPLPNTMSFAMHFNNEQVTIPGIKAAPGTQEAVDAITTASRPISGNAFQDFVKMRNEFTGELTDGPAVVNYYVSTEPDYLGQQLGARYSKDLHGQQLNVSTGASYGWDRIDPLADDDTNTSPASKTTMHVNTVATQILSPSTLLRYGLEYNVVNGLQHNPYRNVYAGGTIVPEREPDHRERRDAFVKLNHYFQERTSLKLSYRFYNDDWGINSHELGSKLSQYITQGLFAQYEYRWYTQTAARFYRDEYTSVNGIDGYLSGDYRMNDLSSHLFGFALDVDLTKLAADSPVLQRMGAWFSYERYFNSNNYSANILETGLNVRF